MRGMIRCHIQPHSPMSAKLRQTIT
jgi:hypothetical protein